jgi:hypothetical protein
MCTLEKLGGIAHKLAAVAAQLRWVFWIIVGYWFGRFLVTQDPIELLLAAVTFVLVHLGGLLLKVISATSNEEAEAHDAGATETEDEVVPTQE